MSAGAETQILAIGLSIPEAARRLADVGPNVVPEAPPPTVLSRVREQLRDPMLLLLLAAGVLTTATRDAADTIVILLVVVLNTSISVVQEVRAEHAMAALRRIAAPHATVRRDGLERELPAAEVVPGDVILLAAGDIVPADAQLVTGHDLQLDESSLTGESIPVERAPGEQVSAGTTVTRGRAFAVVLHTGAESALGRVAALVGNTPRRPTPLQQRMNRLSSQLVRLTLAVAGVVLAVGVVQGRGLIEMLLVAASLAVAAVPESLPAVVAVSLALGAHRMSRRNAIVRWLPAVETLGSVTVLASDKTGTLTENRMVVTRVRAGEREFALEDGLPLRDPALGDLVRDAVLCNDARLSTDGEDGEGRGDPVEVALLGLADAYGADVDEIRASWPRVGEVPFDHARRRMTTVHGSPAGWLVVCKGAPEEVLALVARAAGDNLPAVEAATRAREAADHLAAEGLRVLAVADVLEPDEPAAHQVENRLRLVGLVAVEDPPRPGARDVVRRCREAGVRLVMVTGDHPATAAAVARQVGIDVSGGVVTGVGDGPVGERSAVHARVRPEQKVEVVRTLQAAGEVVAVTGDGVNDAPALTAADIGVAMGGRGTEVARQAADLVLADDDLASVVAAVEEGRRVFGNVRRFLQYALAGGVAEVLVMLVGPVAGLGVPLLPAQILWINLLTHGLPGVAFGAEPLDRTAMRRPSRPPSVSVLSGLVPGVAATGAGLAAASLLAGALASDSARQSVVFAVLGLGQLVVGLALRTPIGRRTLRQRTLEAAVTGAAALTLAGLYVPVLRELLSTRALPGPHLLLLALLAAVPGAVVALVVRVRGQGHGDASAS